MALGAVLLVLIGSLALGLAVDAGRDRHRLRSRLTRTVPTHDPQPPEAAGPVSPLVSPPGGVTG